MTIHDRIDVCRSLMATNQTNYSRNYGTLMEKGIIMATKYQLTETQFTAFTKLCDVMDTGGQTPEQCAVNAHTVGIPWRFISCLTGLTGDQVHAVIKQSRAVMA